MAKRKPDPAHLETDKIISKIEKRITREYTQALNELQEKVDDYFRRYEIKDATWQRWVKENKKTEEQYRDWKIGQLAIGERWEEMRNTIAEDLRNTNNIARSIARGYMPDVYALNHDYTTFIAETMTGIDTSYTLYRREAVERIIRDNPQMLPSPGKKVSQAIADGTAIRWNNQHIQSVMIQQILQGESIPKMAQRLMEKVYDDDRKAAIRNARTMATSAQNAGRLDAMRRCEKKGLHGKKQWIATLDSRTRHAHRQLDGEVVGIDDYFENEFGKIMYPGDMDASPANIWNCRCTMVEVFDEKEAREEARDLSLRNTDKLKEMSYEEWKKSKKIENNPIDLPVKKANAIRGKYIKEYRSL